MLWQPIDFVQLRQSQWAPPPPDLSDIGRIAERLLSNAEKARQPPSLGGPYDARPFSPGWAFRNLIPGAELLAPTKNPRSRSYHAVTPVGGLANCQTACVACGCEGNRNEAFELAPRRH